jgi:hypothetical protein
VRKARLLSTVAATLLLTIGAASAQAPKKDEAPAPAPTAQQTAPAEKIAPALKPGDKKADAKKTPETTGQVPKASDADKTRATDKGAMDKGAMSKDAASPKASQATPEKSSATSGQGAAAGSAKLSTEQRTKISAVLKQQKVAPAQLSVSVRVGTRVPDSVHFYPLPQEVFVIYPEWRGYDYIVVGNEILVIDHRTHEIVAILDA